MDKDDGPEAQVRSSPRLRPIANNALLSPPRRQAKQKRAPSITPRKFNAFFARRSRRSGALASSIDDSSRALGAITGSAVNRRQRQIKDSPIPLKSLGHPAHTQDENGNEAETPRQNKRRKTGHHTPPESSPLKPPPLFQSSPCGLRGTTGDERPKSALLSPLQSLPASSQVTEDISDFECDHDHDHFDFDIDDDPEPPKRLTQLTRRGMAAHLFQRQLGSMPRSGHSHLLTPTSDWRSETANFSSGPQDTHFCTSHEGLPRCIPFCAASCNTDTLVAIGDEEGRVRLLDSSSNARFDKIHLCFQAHGNAIIDLAFSEDDQRLATASGDQTGKVVDMMTQTPISILGQHTASLKQVRFQPGRGEGHVLATSSRDGSIQIWDLRCHGGGPVMDTFTMERDAGLRYSAPRQLTSGCVVNSFFGAHEAMPRHQTRSVGLASTSTAHTTDHPDVASRGEVPGRIGEVSVTAIQWLPAGREHLLLSACEADASIKLWDIRSIHTSRNHRAPTPLSYTAPPTSHTTWRHFGISSLSLSSDGGRLYALCKDNTVYAYSTSHMVLGPPPGSSTSGGGGGGASRRPKHAPADEMPGPLYGFRHPSFHATSFYVKSALRSPRDGRSELLAVGSADNCTVLFPTDENLFKGELEATYQLQQNNLDATFTSSLSSSFSRPSTAASRSYHFPRTSSFASGALRAPARDDIPIIRTVAGRQGYGTQLVRGHEKEVGSLCWTSEGKLVTVGDDYMVRCWDEGNGGGNGDDRHGRGKRARDLRTLGEGEGRRWGCGWAEIEDDWDGDEDEEGEDVDEW
ncbi:Cell division cycle protein cdt2 [Cytospora mali]|uniref:Cell division cycle protein cdt2 n=1 Tax=Cytospora mali TaxID=578113 RepID=A0A194VCZ8_CYTMA|nr:Cell division cycle protein cdt2 [Valsa mali var. pyri (nom. inval.)]